MGKYKTSHADARRAERTIAICLRGDLVADWEAANRDLERAEREIGIADSKEGSGVTELAERVRALEAEIREHTETWRLRAMAPHRFRELVKAHPPRTGEDGEVIPADRLGLNYDTFFPALVRLTVVEPDQLDEDDWLWLLGNPADADSEPILSDRQRSDLYDAAWFVNRGEVGVPFSHAAWRMSRDTSGE